MSEQVLIAWCTLLAGVWAMQVMFNCGTASAAFLLRVPVDCVTFGVGPTLLRFRLGRAQILLALIPIAGSVRFTEPLVLSAGDVDRSYLNAPWLKKILLSLAGPISAIVLSLVIAGTDAVRAAVQLWPDLVSVVGNIQRPLHLSGLLWPLIAERGVLFAGAIVVAKAASFNLMPIPILNGGSILVCLVEAALGRRLSAPMLEATYKVGFVLLFSIVAIVVWRLYGVALLS